MPGEEQNKKTKPLGLKRWTNMKVVPRIMKEKGHGKREE